VSTPRESRTAERILDVAERLVQTRGFNAFSYADVSKTLGIRKASLHHHYATKAALGAALLARYREAFVGELARIERGPGDALDRLERYVTLYGTVLRRGRMCMCGMLAADVSTLPRAMRESVASFFSENEAWLARVLAEGRRSGGLSFAGRPAAMADVFVSSLEGAMLVARGGGKAQAFATVADHLLGGIRPRRQSARSTRRRLGRGRTLGTSSLKRPSLKSARMRSGSTSSGKRKPRANGP